MASNGGAGGGAGAGAGAAFSSSNRGSGSSSSSSGGGGATVMPRLQRKRINDAATLDRVRQLVWRLSQAPHRNSTRLPGPLATTANNRTLRSVVAKRDKYWVCEKSDGERAMFLCMQR